MERKIFIGVPSHNGQICGDLMLSMIDAVLSGEPIVIAHQGYSLLTRNFNLLLANAINEKCSHFIMVHSDIVPGPGWIQKMVEVMIREKCEILSVVSPIKNTKAQTSCAHLLDIEPFRARRMTLKEIADLPMTFQADDLLVNTGLMMIDLSAPWVGKIWFRVEDYVHHEDGLYKPAGISEDWLFSMDARAAGAKIMATREVKLKHVGSASYSNDPKEWGI